MAEAATSTAGRDDWPCRPAMTRCASSSPNSASTVVIANHNAPQQVVLSGPRRPSRGRDGAEGRGLSVTALPVATGVPLAAGRGLRRALRGVPRGREDGRSAGSRSTPSDGAPYPAMPERRAAQTLAGQLGQLGAFRRDDRGDVRGRRPHLRRGRPGPVLTGLVAEMPRRPAAPGDRRSTARAQQRRHRASGRRSASWRGRRAGRPSPAVGRSAGRAGAEKRRFRCACLRITGSISASPTRLGRRRPPRRIAGEAESWRRPRQRRHRPTSPMIGKALSQRLQRAREPPNPRAAAPVAPPCARADLPRVIGTDHRPRRRRAPRSTSRRWSQRHQADLPADGARTRRQTQLAYMRALEAPCLATTPAPPPRRR